MNTLKRTSENDPIIARIVELLKQQNKKQIDLTDYLGITKNAFTDWKSGRISSYQKHLPQIADYFGVSVDYLLGRPSIFIEEKGEFEMNPEERTIEITVTERELDREIAELKFTITNMCQKEDFSMVDADTVRLLSRYLGTMRFYAMKKKEQKELLSEHNYRLLFERAAQELEEKKDELKELKQKLREKGEN